MTKHVKTIFDLPPTSRRGAAFMEYAIMISLIAGAVIGSVTLVGREGATAMGHADAAITSAKAAAGSSSGGSPSGSGPVAGGSSPEGFTVNDVVIDRGIREFLTGDVVGYILFTGDGSAASPVFSVSRRDGDVSSGAFSFEIGESATDGSIGISVAFEPDVFYQVAVSVPSASDPSFEVDRDFFFHPPASPGDEFCTASGINFYELEMASYGYVYGANAEIEVRYGQPTGLPVFSGPGSENVTLVDASTSENVPDDGGCPMRRTSYLYSLTGPVPDPSLITIVVPVEGFGDLVFTF